MSDSGQTTITFVPPPKPPDPNRTFVRSPEELDLALANLPEGAPIVISHNPEEIADLTVYIRMLDRANAAGRDVVLMIEPE